jgi:hypothetical protein
MSTPPVELTEADITAIMEAFQKPDRTVAMFGAVARIKAAARREALLEAESRLQPPPPWPASDKKVANDRGYAAGWCDALSVVEELRAEPVRDEEGGR